MNERERHILSRARRAHALALQRTGMSYVEVGRVLGVTGGRASEIVRAGERQSERKEEAYARYLIECVDAILGCLT